MDAVFYTSHSQLSIMTKDEVSQLQLDSFSHFYAPGFPSLPFSRDPLIVYVIPGSLCNIHITEHHGKGCL